MSIPTSALSSPARHHPPQRQPATIDRPRLATLLDDAVARNAVTIVSAPSGFGKTTTVAAWAQSGAHTIAWLALGPLDDEHGHVDSGIVATLESILRDRGRDYDPQLLAPDTEPIDVGEMHQRLQTLIAAFDTPVVLVVDDAQRALQSLATGLLGALVAETPAPLRVVLVGTTPLELALSRYILNNLDAVIGAEALAFDAGEVAALAGEMASAADAAAVHGETGGWPIAVRLGLLGRANQRTTTAGAERGLMREYVRDVVLSALPADLARFVMDAAVSDEMTPQFAAALTGRSDAARLLGQCRRLGLFLDRHDGPGGAVYRWHSLFARHCRTILEEDDPARLIDLRRRAAALLVEARPLDAAEHLLAVGDAAIAVDVILDTWVSLVVGTEAAAVDRACMTLPPPLSEDPAILLVRASACEAIGESKVAATLFERAQASAPAPDDTRLDRYERTLQLARLFLLDRRSDLVAAAAAVRDRLVLAEEAPAREQAAILFLLGWTELRERSDPWRAVETLSVAARHASAVGDTSLARRANECLAFALASAGQLRRSRDLLEALDVLEPDESDESPWRVYAGGGAAAAGGMVAYWTGDFQTAERQFVRTLALAGGRQVFASFARAMLAYNAAAAGDARMCRRAAFELQHLPTVEEKGVDWYQIRVLAIAVLEEAVGHGDRALDIARRFGEDASKPLLAVLAAGILRRAGDYPLARRLLRQNPAYADVSYVRVNALLTRAVALWETSDSAAAHDTCEQAIDLAAREAISIPFAEDDPEVRAMLNAHVAWGTDHEEFLMRCLRPTVATSPLAQLSERERDVFEQLRTTLTTTEIADRLGVSVNTVKTHQRSIYRKLGVTSRREALRQYA